MRKITKKISFKTKSRIPEFKSREAEARFWDTHSFADYWDEFKPVKVTFNLKKKKEDLLTIRLQSDIKESLDKVADEFGINSSTLARMWLIEKLREAIRSGKPI